MPVTRSTIYQPYELPSAAIVEAGAPRNVSPRPRDRGAVLAELADQFVGFEAEFCAAREVGSDKVKHAGEMPLDRAGNVFGVGPDPGGDIEFL